MQHNENLCVRKSRVRLKMPLHGRRKSLAQKTEEHFLGDAEHKALPWVLSTSARQDALLGNTRANECDRFLDV